MIEGYVDIFILSCVIIASLYGELITVIEKDST